MEIFDKPSLTRYLNTPLPIGNKSISNRMILAPMAGLGHIAFRELVSEFGGFGLLFTGMCSAKAVPQENPIVSKVFSWRKAELPHTVCQIFGATPQSMAAAAVRIQAEGFFGVDLNFGCSVAAICKKGCGAALLKTPDLATDIVAAVRKAVDFPVFVKFRTGWENNPELAAGMAKRFEDAGASALIFHPRVAPDRRNRPPRWDFITRVREAVAVPVFGNGNLFDMEDGIKMAGQTGCHGLALGRMAVSKPWIFAQWSQGFVPDKTVYQTTATRMAQLLSLYYDDRFAVKMFKKFAPYFCANFKFAHSILKQLNRASTIEQIHQNIDVLLEQTPQTLTRPNLNLFL